MDTRRLAVALLRLYPRAWRARYGDELLGLIDDAGLSWRIVADVAAGAAVERVRALVAWRNPPLDPVVQARVLASGPGRESALDAIAFGALILTTVGVLAAAGVAWPQWSWWFCMFSGPPTSSRVYLPSASRAERVGWSYYRFVEGAAFAGSLWWLARVAIAMGVPVPPSPRVEVALLVFALTGLARLIYCGIRSVATPRTWMGVYQAEVWGWRCGAIAAMVSVFMVDPGGEVFWLTALLSLILLRTPTGSFTRVGAARQRAAYELEQQRLREKFPVRRYPADWR